MKHITCLHCGDTYPDFDVAHVCSKGPYAPKLNDNIKTGAAIHAGDGGYSEGTQEEYEKFVKIRNHSLVKARLKEFEKQSGLEIYGLGAKQERWEKTVEKFAELIVAECAEFTFKYTSDEKNIQEYNQVGWDFLSGDLRNAIREHFGVNK
jgi:hypothetical protein